MELKSTFVATIEFSDTVFESNSASNGGALYVLTFRDTIDTNNITLINNRATDSGGAMYLSYSLGIYFKLSITLQETMEEELYYIIQYLKYVILKKNKKKHHSLCS